MRRPCAMTPFPALAPPMGDGGLPCHARWQNVLTLPGPPRGRAPWAAPECGAFAEPRAGRGPEPRGEWREWLSPRLAGGASLDAAPWCARSEERRVGKEWRARGARWSVSEGEGQSAV